MVNNVLEFLKQREEGKFKIEEGYEGVQLGIKNNNIKKPVIREAIISLLLFLPAPLILFWGLQIFRWSELSDTEQICVGFLAYIMAVLIAFFVYHLAIDDYIEARERIYKSAISDYQYQYEKECRQKRP